MRTLTIDELLARYGAGERDFSQMKIEGRKTLSIKNANLSKANFQASHLYCGFENVDLSGAIFSKANLKAWFRGANLIAHGSLKNIGE